MTKLTNSGITTNYLRIDTNEAILYRSEYGCSSQIGINKEAVVPEADVARFGSNVWSKKRFCYGSGIARFRKLLTKEIQYHTRLTIIIDEIT